MKVLLMNTCGSEGILALAEDSGVIAEERLPARGSSEALLPGLRKLLESRGWRPEDLGAVGAVLGPGSFTGVRVGLAAAKGLCEGRGIPLVGMSRLVLVARARDGACGVLDAGRGEYYCGAEFDSERMLSSVEVRGLAATRALVTCEERVVRSLGSSMELISEPGGEAMASLMYQRMAAGHWSDVASSDANYLRRTDAELLSK